MDIEERINYQFKNKQLLKEALSHPSLSSEIRPAPADNQRLEYLGDAVLELVISTHLYHRYPDLQEGPLTKSRALIVSKPTLAQAARRVNLGADLILSNGEANSGGRDRDSNLADVFESLVGAVYLDSGLEAAQSIILQLLNPEIKSLDPSKTTGNAKGTLQEILQKISPESPVYKVISQDGPPHNRSFCCAVTWKNVMIGKGEGMSKKSAEASAALQALKSEIWKHQK